VGRENLIVIAVEAANRNCTFSEPSLDRTRGTRHAGFSWRTQKYEFGCDLAGMPDKIPPFKKEKS
jgi:hypothetical protein